MEIITNELRKVVLEVGSKVLLLQQSTREVEEETKGINDYLTKADKLVIDTLIPFFQSNYPDYTIIDEEINGLTSLKSTGKFVVIDPIDGTGNWRRGHKYKENPQGKYWAISIGFVEDGLPVAGLVYAPVLHALWYGQDGYGVYLNGKQVFPSRKRSYTWTFDFPYPDNKQRFVPAKNFYSKLIVHVPDIQLMRMQSSVVGILSVLQGDSDLFFQFGGKPWDYAAVWALAVALGYDVKTLWGTPATLNEPGLVFNRSEDRMEEFYELIHEVFPIKK